ncbi:MAG: ThiF family adenylyltransferase [Pseudomonadota bacterium]
MKFWWLSDYRRVGNERDAVEKLASEGYWFTIIRWAINKFRLSVEGVISAHGIAYPVRLIYPDQFPLVPAWVEPQDETVRWSNHQYGAGGVLCLELRPDNWTPNATGADVLRSAYDLLYTENPLGEGAREHVPSDHRISGVQSYDWGREPVLIGGGCFDRLQQGVSEGVSALRWQADDNVWPVLVFDAEDRARPQHPPSFDLGTLRLELPVVVGYLERPDQTPADRETLAAMLGVGLNPEIHKGGIVALAIGANAITPYHSPDAASVYERKWVVLPDETGLRSGRQASVSEKMVAVIGLGSIGSKVAEILLRSGVFRFVLVDGDVMLPANLERHTLDWRDVGFRKAEAVQRRLRHIVPGASIEAIPGNLNWQRSAKTYASQVDRIAACDLIIDATGDAASALLLGAIATENSKPFLSATVFEGGLGCMIARSIPGRDPPYAYGRVAYNAFCDEKNVAPPPSGRRTYESLNEAGEPIVADDAAVTMGAAHAARVALNILDEQIGPDEAAWLLMGFKAGWLFKRHGHSIALDVGSPPPATFSESNSEAQDFVNSLVKEVLDAAKTSS